MRAPLPSHLVNFGDTQLLTDQPHLPWHRVFSSKQDGHKAPHEAPSPLTFGEFGDTHLLGQTRALLLVGLSVSATSLLRQRDLNFACRGTFTSDGVCLATLKRKQSWQTRPLLTSMSLRQMHDGPCCGCRRLCARPGLNLHLPLPLQAMGNMAFVPGHLGMAWECHEQVSTYLLALLCSQCLLILLLCDADCCQGPFAGLSGDPSSGQLRLRGLMCAMKCPRCSLGL